MAPPRRRNQNDGAPPAPDPVNLPMTGEASPGAPVADGEPFDWEDFESLALAPDLLAFGNSSNAKRMKEKDARAALRERLTTMVGARDDSLDEGIVENVADAIVRSLPKEALFEPAIRGLDLRPYLNVLATTDKPIAPFFARHAKGERVETEYRELVGSFVGRVDEYVVQQADLTVPDGSSPAAYEAAREAMRQGGTGTTVGLAPEVVSARTTGMVNNQTGEAVYGAAAINAATALDGPTQVSRGPVWEEPQFVARLRAGVYTVDDLLAAESSDDNLSGAEYQFTTFPAGGDGFSSLSAKQLTTTQALGYFGTLTTGETKVMQRKLERAGYFERAGGDYLPGDQFDPATDKAWKMALADSLRMGKSIDETLDTQAAMFDQYMRTLTPQLPALNRDALAADANKLAASSIGRELSQSELQEIANELQRRNRQRPDLRPTPQYGALGRQQRTYALPEIDADAGYASEDVASVFERHPGLAEERSLQRRRYRMDFAIKQLMPDLDRTAANS